MREAPIILAVLLLGGAWPVHAAPNPFTPGPTPAEEWVGECRLGAGAMPLSIRIEGRSADATGWADLPAHGGRTALADLSRTGEGIAFALPGLGVSFRLTRPPDGSRAEGTCTRAALAGTATLVRVQSVAQPVDEYAGSYLLSDGRMIDLGPFDEMGGRLVFLEHGGLEERPLFGLEPDHLVAGPSLGVPYPFVFDVRFVRNARGAISGLTWKRGEAPALNGIRTAPHQRVDAAVRNGDVTLRGTLFLPEGPVWRDAMARLTLVIEEAQLRWLRQRAHDAVMAGKRTDMSAIVRELVDAAMQRERDGEPKPPTPR